MVWCTPDYSPDDSRSFIAKSQADWNNGHSYCFAILDVKDNSFLGSVGLTQINRAHNIANIGIWVRTTRTCRGAGAAATRLVARFAFQELRLSRLEFLVAADNKASARVAEKVHARVEGLLRQRLIISGKSHDALLCSLIPSDLTPL